MLSFTSILGKMANGHFRIQSENPTAQEQTPVVELHGLLVAGMKRQTRTRNGLGANESSPCRNGNLIHLRQNVGNEKQDRHNQHCETFTRHLSSGGIEGYILFP